MGTQGKAMPRHAMPCHAHAFHPWHFLPLLSRRDHDLGIG
jgi:hypothetical protein